MNIKRIVKEIKNGNLVITPTDTIYGILADATNSDAIKKVYACKKRNKNKALILLAASPQMIQEYIKTLSPKELEIIKKYFPGKLTILLSKNSQVKDEITANSPLVGIRIPDNQDLIKIIKEIGNPLISTSVNLSGAPAITNPKEIDPKLLKYISYIEDNGSIISEPSSIIKVENEKIIVIRPGTIASKIIKDYKKNKGR